MNKKLFFIITLMLTMSATMLSQTPSAKAIWCSGNTTLYFTYDANTYAAGGTYEGETITAVYSVATAGYTRGNEKDQTLNRYHTTAPWDGLAESATRVIVASNFSGFKPTSLVYWFYEFSKLTTFTGAENINTSNVTSLGSTFYNCSGLTSLDVSNWNTSNVTTLYSTFYQCSGLTSLDVSNWDTSNVTVLHSTFYKCRGLTSLDVSGWDTRNVTTLYGTFYNCSGLESLNLSNWDVSNVTDLQETFCHCSGLTSLDVSNWNTSNITNLRYAFEGCSNLTSLDVAKKTITKGGTTYVAWDTSKVRWLSSTFHSCGKLEELDVSNWDTSNVTSLSLTFWGCHSLPSLDLSGWNTSNVTTLEYTFFGCRGLTSLDVSNWDTSKVTTLECTFGSCSSLTSLDVAKKTITKGGTIYVAWDTSKVTTFRQTFGRCTGLTSLDEISNWDTSNVTSLQNTFWECIGLTSLDLSNWDTSNVTTLEHTFWDCRGLISLDLSNWNTRKVTTLVETFYKCSSLTSLTFGKDFTTEKVTSQNDTFKDCPKLRYIDFYASDDTDAITAVDRNSTGMFNGVPATTVIYLPHGSQDVTDAQNVVYSYNGDENDLRCPEYYSEDKVDIEFPRDFKTNTAIYQRTMSNNYGSVILPYDFTTNDNVQAYTLDEEHTETMYFRDTQTVTAHTPFAFNVKKKSSGNVVDFTMTDSSNSFGITVKATHTTHPDETGWDGVAGAPYSSNTNLTGWTAKGYYVNQTIEKTDPLYSDLHYIAGEKFYKAAGETLKFPPHRVTFHGTWAKGNTSSGAKSFVFLNSYGDDVTNIEEAIVEAEKRNVVEIFDVSGRRQHEAQKGVNIVRMKDGSVRKMFVK